MFISFMKAYTNQSMPRTQTLKSINSELRSISEISELNLILFYTILSLSSCFIIIDIGTNQIKNLPNNLHFFKLIFIFKV